MPLSKPIHTYILGCCSPVSERLQQSFDNGSVESLKSLWVLQETWPQDGSLEVFVRGERVAELGKYEPGSIIELSLIEVNKAQL